VAIGNLAVSKTVEIPCGEQEGAVVPVAANDVQPRAHNLPRLGGIDVFDLEDVRVDARGDQVALQVGAAAHVDDIEAPGQHALAFTRVVVSIDHPDAVESVPDLFIRALHVVWFSP